MKNKTALIMCLWRRISNLKRTLDLLSKQSSKEFDIFLWNNNIQEKENIENIVGQFKFTSIEVKHSKENIGGIGRFYFAKNISNNGYENVIFIDDDQIFDENLIRDFISVYEKNSVKSWWAWRAKESYFDRVRCQKDGDKPNYCGTGGMICDIEIFKDNRVISEIPKQFQFIEDLWVSYFANHILGWKLGVVNTNLKILEDGKDQYVKLKKDKDIFYKQLKKTGWK